jgi:hypothetical protein
MSLVMSPAHFSYYTHCLRREKYNESPCPGESRRSVMNLSNIFFEIQDELYFPDDPNELQLVYSLFAAGQL